MLLEPGPGGPPALDSLPSNPWVAVVSVAASVVIAALPYLLAHRKPKTPPALPDVSDAPAGGDDGPPRVVVDLPRPVSVAEGSPEWLLVRMVNNLERRVDAAEKRAEDIDQRWQERYATLERRHSDLQRDHYKALAEVKTLRSDTAELRGEVRTLRGRLTGGERGL